VRINYVGILKECGNDIRTLNISGAKISKAICESHHVCVVPGVVLPALWVMTKNKVVLRLKTEEKVW
jgi:hypothetical protein